VDILLSFRLVCLSGLSLPAEVIQLSMSLLSTLSYVIRTRRFILRDVRLPSLHSLTVSLFTLVAMRASEAYSRCEEQVDKRLTQQFILLQGDLIESG
jgi:hypothetical protein